MKSRTITVGPDTVSERRIDRHACEKSHLGLRPLSICCFIAFLAAAQVRPLPGYTAGRPFQNISIEDGLSQNTILCMLQDRDRFMWFGSEDGLNRFDGYTFKVYRHSKGHDESLADDQVTCLLNGDDGTLWVGTQGGGLDRFDPVRETFSHHRFDPRNERSLSNNSIRVILPDGKGSFWVGTENGLNLFDPRSGTAVRIPHFQGRAGIASSCAILCLDRDQAGILWLGTRDGLYRYDPVSGRCQALSGSGSAVPNMTRRSNQINAIFEDGLENVWLGTEAGLVLFNKRDGTFQVKEERNRDKPLSHLYRSRILSIIRDNRGSVWVGCETGIYLFPHPGQLAVYFRAGAVPQRLLTNCFIISLFQDSESILWAGTFSGIWKYDLSTRQFALYGPELSARTEGDIRFPVNSICLDNRDWLWIGTYKYGLFGVHRGSDERKTFTSLPGNPQPLNETIVSALRIDRQGTLWIGTQSGLHSYDIAGDRFTGYYHQGRNGGGLGDNAIVSIFEDRSGRLWVGTKGGLNLFDPGRRRFASYHNTVPTELPVGRDIVSQVIQDRNGAMWVATFGGGLFLFDPGSGRFVKNYIHRDDDPASLSSNNLYCLLEDSRGRFWVGTSSGGLNLFDRARGTFSHVTVEDGMPNNSVLGMLEDKNGNLWLSTSRGICRYDPQRKMFRNFTARDGLQADEFLPMVYFKGADGELFFGGPNGLTSFFAEKIKDNPHVPPLVITEVEIFNRNQTIAGGLNRMKNLELGYKDSIVSFAFAALSYADSRRNQYAYKIEGLHDDWIQIGNRHEVTVSNLRPGHYVFRVKGSNNHGVWNEEGVALAIDMRPPWWQTWWFRVLACLLLVFVFIQLNRTRSRRLAARIRTEAAMEQYLNKCDISQREKEIVMLLLKGKSNKEIEDALFIAMGTVKNHVYSIYQKIGVKNRAQLMTLFKNLPVK
jgi:ligand-binding sensor domain-containing protein/DNA-binding CsgD family transcriptional regulator